MSLAEFFSDTEPKVVYSPEEAVAVEGRGVNSFELLVPGSTNNLMDPVLLILNPGEALEESQPHPGEQFGYVLKGTATLRLDGKRYKVPTGHCFYFKSDRRQQIRNDSKSPVKMLWLLSPPQM